MHRTMLFGFTLVLAAALQAAGQEAAEKAKAKAKELLTKYQEAVVTVKIVSTTRFALGGGLLRNSDISKQEHKNEVTGTVVDPSGLTVLSNFSTDSNSALDGFEFEQQGEKVSFKPETAINDLKIILSDGTELDAQFVLRDQDLDLAFVKPKEQPAQPLPFIPFTKPAAEPEILDRVLSIGRLGRIVNRVPSVTVGEISALVKKPRPFYVTGASALGSPVFNLKGETLGLAVMRKSQEKAQLFSLSGGFQPVVLPSEDLMEIAKQAAAAKPEPQKTAEGAKEKEEAQK